MKKSGIFFSVVSVFSFHNKKPKTVEIKTVALALKKWKKGTENAIGRQDKQTVIK